MNVTLWVIWLSLLILFSSVCLTIGGRYCVSEDLLADTWRDGYEQGCDDELSSCVPAPGVRPPPWPEPGVPPKIAESTLPRWDDTAENLAALAAPYYEPLARGGDLPTPDMPGPGPSYTDVLVPRLGSFIAPGEFPTSPIYDRLAAEYLRSPLTAGPPGDGASPPGTALAPDDPRHDPVPGDSIWDQLAADVDEDPEINLWSIRADHARCMEISRELRQLARTLAAT